MIRRFLSVPVASVLVLCGAAVLPVLATPSYAAQFGMAQAAKFTATQESETAHTVGKPLRVSTDNGSIKVTKGSGDKVRVTAKLRATTQERLDATKVTTVRNADGSLTVSVTWPGNDRKSSEGCDLEVSIPDVSAVTATTSNGSITAKGLSGAATLGTSNGSIGVDAWEGDLKADTSNGSIEANAVTGKVDAKSSNGRVKATDVQGPVTIDTSNASVDVSLKGKAPGPVRIHTNNGGVHLRVGPAFAGKLHAETSNGTISVKGAHAKAVGKPARDEGTWQFGQGGADSEVETDNGGVTVEVVESGD
ncbi:MAG: DUF4097 family beta strand repeat-containing protein [Phycisphaerales bacterium]